jgi:hypothetical protein
MIATFVDSPCLRRRAGANILAAALLVFLADPASAASTTSPYRGLWVGDVTLKYATEVTVGLNKNNVPIAPDPKVPTPTSDEANLRLILHVNGAGQVNLLKEVAVLNRKGETNLVTSESDFSLVSDGRLYSSFPQQVAQRFASAVFDFGDSKATEAVDQVMEKVAGAVAFSILNSGQDFSTEAGQTAAKNSAISAATAAANPVAQNADVATSFANFLISTNFNQAFVNKLAGSANPAAMAAGVLSVATALQNSSFYGDSRAVQMVNAVVAAITSASTGAAKTNAAQNTAASFTDVDNNYQRFIEGQNFGDMITAASLAAAQRATNSNATASNITTFVNGTAKVVAVKTEGIQINSTYYTDTRSSTAISNVLNAVISNAVSYLPANAALFNTIAASAGQAGRGALASNVVRYPVPAIIPTPDYNAFIKSNLFTTSPALAAAAAAQAAMAERRDNTLFTATSLTNVAKIAAVTALRDVYAAAARAVRTELPLAGTFAPGTGDTRFTWDARQTNSLIGSPALAGTVVLPANHPTNPFRHRRHPDHTVGFDITRNVQISFDANTNGLQRAGYGVDRITGVYREEILGLHKPLGPDKDTGLRVEGRLQLNRVSLIDTLNAR